ncbi:MAG: family 43 glycosylhydrolase, partial [Clostridia bacterium]|nr:family 43 glycosylhydrolase [Clostridia bacterium]
MKKRIVNGPIEAFYQRHDTDGNIINASDGGIIFAEGKYHWYGLALRPLPFAAKGEGGQVTDKGVVMYASTDLVNWEYEGVILECSDDPNSILYAPMRFERPKILYNEKTKQYVLWSHFVGYPGDHGFADTLAEAGVAVCDTVNGKYRFLGIQRPIDRTGRVRDCTVYKDDDGSAYFIYDRHVAEHFTPDPAPFERCLHIVKLTDDYTGFTDEYAK